MNVIASPLMQSPVRVRYEDGDIELDYATPIARLAGYERPLTIAEYNWHYADYVRRSAATFGQADINEQCLIDAHAWARTGGDGWANVRPPEGWPQADAYVPGPACPRCDGTGVTAFVWVSDGVCFRCNGSGINPDYVFDAEDSDCSGPTWFHDENHWEPCIEHGTSCELPRKPLAFLPRSAEEEPRSTDARVINP